MMDLETALREQIRLAVNAQLSLDAVTNHCCEVLEKFRSNLDEELPDPPIISITDDRFVLHNMSGEDVLTPGQEAYAAHLAEMKTMGKLDIDTQPTRLPFPLPGSEVPFMGIEAPMFEAIDVPSCGVQYEGDTSLNTGHTAFIRYE